MKKTVDDAAMQEVLAPVPAEENRRREQRVRRDFFRTLRRAAGRLPFMDEIVAAYFCALDERTPTRVRGILLAALVYFVVPLDIVPDFLAGIGFTDDVAVLTAAIGAIQSHITPAHRAAARTLLRK